MPLRYTAMQFGLKSQLVIVKQGSLGQTHNKISHHTKKEVEVWHRFLQKKFPTLSLELICVLTDWSAT